MMKVVSQKLITGPYDVLELEILDLSRLNGYWANSSEALKCVVNWLENMVVATVVDVPDFEDAPKREDWPGWSHRSNHPKMGRKYWNWFYLNFPNSTIRFADEPDFQGTLGDVLLYQEAREKLIPMRVPFIWGDIGQVSVSTFAMVQKQMRKHDLWISVLYDGTTHVILEWLVDMPELVSWRLGRTVRENYVINEINYLCGSCSNPRRVF